MTAEPVTTAAARVATEPAATLRGYYRQMVLIRRFEQRAAQMYQRARIGGYCHLNLGEEATVVGADGRAASRATTCSPTTASTATRSRAASSPAG